jgi:hypothetical protein
MVIPDALRGSGVRKPVCQTILGATHNKATSVFSGFDNVPKNRIVGCRVLWNAFLIERGKDSIRLAVTVDDLPVHGPISGSGWTRLGVARAVLQALHDNGITKAYGFANGYMEVYEPGVDQVLRQWLEAGYPLGNHTYDHVDLDRVSAQAYIAKHCANRSSASDNYARPAAPPPSPHFPLSLPCRGRDVAKAGCL